MKKILLLIVTVCIAFSFVSCKKTKIFKDECECFLDMADAQKFAEKNKQNILLLITSRGDDYISQQFIDEILMSDDFKNQIAKKYTVCHYDFSQYSYEKTIVPENATQEEQENIEHYSELMQTGYQFACLLDCRYTPAIFLLTKENYVISEVDYNDEILSVDTFADLLASYDDMAAEYNELIDKTKKGSSLEKARAIDSLCNATPEKYRTMLLDLTKTIPELDKNNETGLCSKYIVDAAEAQAITLYTQGNLVGAVQSYISACDNKFIEASEKQECYYMAAYLLASSGSDDYNVILSYLNSALEANPEGDKTSYIQSAIDYYKSQNELNLNQNNQENETK